MSAKCSPDAFAMAGRTETPMNVVAVIQHTAGEYLGLMEDHLEGRRIRFQYFRPFTGGGKLPAPELPADALFLLGGGPWGSSGTRDLPTLDAEIALVKARLEEGTPVVGVGLGGFLSKLQTVADDIGHAMKDFRCLVIVSQNNRVSLFLQPVDGMN